MVRYYALRNGVAVYQQFEFKSRWVKKINQLKIYLLNYWV